MTSTNQLEQLEDRQLFSTFGTMNVIDASTSPGMVASYTLNGAPDSGDAGVYNWTRSAANPGSYAGVPLPGQTFGAFCLEPDQAFASGSNIPFTVSDLASAPDNGTYGPLGAAKSDEIRELWGRFRSTIGNDNTRAAAFQVAIWEIVTDTGHDLSSGHFVADASTPAGAAIKSQAQTYLNQLDGAAPKANLFALTSPIDQDQVFEVPTTTPLVKGMTATIGYWQNKNGQRLLKSLNGSANATNLGNWLATNFPNLWGANAGPNNLAGRTNTQVAAFYVSKFNVKGQKLDAQILAVAFATYVTNSSLAGNVAAAYGFKVNANGTGNATISIGSAGAAFGVANNTSLTVWQILKANDTLSAGGTGATQFDIYNGKTALRNLANTVYTFINEHGDI